VDKEKDEKAYTTSPGSFKREKEKCTAISPA
jgi:hypothetical protein